MAHFAKLDADNVVITVNVVDNENLIDENGNENEQVGIEYLESVTGYPKWKQCSYNGNFRKLYPGAGCTYNEQLDAFLRAKPFPSWVLNPEKADWEAPVALPEGASILDYRWDEQNQQWVELDPPTS